MSFFDVLDYCGCKDYQLLPDQPSLDLFQQAGQYQLQEYANRSPQHEDLVLREIERREAAGQSPSDADLKLFCLKILLGSLLFLGEGAKSFGFYLFGFQVANIAI
jgi:hypothetical protein